MGLLGEYLAPQKKEESRPKNQWVEVYLIAYSQKTEEEGVSVTSALVLQEDWRTRAGTGMLCNHQWVRHKHG